MCLHCDTIPAKSADMLAGTQTQKRLGFVCLEQLHLLQVYFGRSKNGQCWYCVKEAQPSFLQLMPSVKMGFGLWTHFTQHTLLPSLSQNPTTPPKAHSNSSKNFSEEIIQYSRTFCTKTKSKNIMEPSPCTTPLLSRAFQRHP